MPFAAHKSLTRMQLAPASSMSLNTTPKGLSAPGLGGTGRATVSIQEKERAVCSGVTMRSLSRPDSPPSVRLNQHAVHSERLPTGKAPAIAAVSNPTNNRRRRHYRKSGLSQAARAPCKTATAYRGHAVVVGSNPAGHQIRTCHNRSANPCVAHISQTAKARPLEKAENDHGLPRSQPV